MENVVSEADVNLLLDVQWYLIAVGGAGFGACAVTITVLWRRWENGRRRRAAWLAAAAAGLFVLLGVAAWFGPVVAGNFVPPSGGHGIYIPPADCDAALRTQLAAIAERGVGVNVDSANDAIGYLQSISHGECDDAFWSPRAMDVVPWTYVCPVAPKIGILMPPPEDPGSTRPEVWPEKEPWDDSWLAHRTVSAKGVGLLVYFTNGVSEQGEDWRPPEDGAKCWVWKHWETGSYWIDGEWFAGY